MHDFQPDDVQSFFDKEPVNLRNDENNENFEQYEGGRDSKRIYRDQQNSIVSKTSAGRSIQRDSSDKKKLNDLSEMDIPMPVARD